MTYRDRPGLPRRCRRPGRRVGGSALTVTVLLSSLLGCAPAAGPPGVDPAPPPAASSAPRPGLQPCAASTRDLGVHETYRLGVREDARLCAVIGFASSGSESTPGSEFYVKGARQEVIVRSQASEEFARLVQQAERLGVPLSAASSFRTHQHQKRLCREDAACRQGDHLLVAPPGWSNHQSGLAVDVVGTRVVGTQTCGQGRARDLGSPIWRFMEKHGRALGLLQYAAESWHWESRQGAVGRGRC